MQNQIPNVRVTYYKDYFYNQAGKPMNGYAIEMQLSNTSEPTWNLVCFCEDKNGSVSSVFIESIFDIAAMGYNIQFEK